MASNMRDTSARWWPFDNHMQTPSSFQVSSGGCSDSAGFAAFTLMDTFGGATACASLAQSEARYPATRHCRRRLDWKPLASPKWGCFRVPMIVLTPRIRAHSKRQTEPQTPPFLIQFQTLNIPKPHLPGPSEGGSQTAPPPGQLRPPKEPPKGPVRVLGFRVWV